MSNVTILVGAQWGDEGKGKWVDILAEKAQIVARFQGGNNAGHTLYVDGQKVVLHQIPSGAFRDGTIGALSAGVVINPVQLVEELGCVQQFTDLPPSRLWLSVRAHVITPWHIAQDHAQESLATNPIGTTKRGIGPTYEAKYARRGLRLGHYVDDEARMAWLAERSHVEPAFRAHIEDHKQEWEAFHRQAAVLRPYVCDSELRLRSSIEQGAQVLLEGAQGALLDIDHGTYPFVTSSSTMVGGAPASVGFGVKHIGQILGVAKAYTTRVGEGPFPSELEDSTGLALARAGHEFGATTGRPRRCGWLDAVALRHVYKANGLDGIILNKMDVLSGFSTLKICTAYDHPTLGRITDFPWDPHVLTDCKPVYEIHPGWSEPLSQRRWSDLPAAAKSYISAVAQAIDGEVLMVGTGVNRGDALYR